MRSCQSPRCKTIDAISVVGGDALPVCPFGDCAIDLLLLGRISGLSKVDEEGIIAADVGLDFASKLFRLRPAQPTRLDSGYNIPMSLKSSNERGLIRLRQWSIPTIGAPSSNFMPRSKAA